MRRSTWRRYRSAPGVAAQQKRVARWQHGHIGRASGIPVARAARRGPVLPALLLAAAGLAPAAAAAAPPPAVEALATAVRAAALGTHRPATSAVPGRLVHSAVSFYSS